MPGGVAVKRIRQFLSVLAVTALAAAGIGTGSALAASRSVPKTKAQWQADIGHLRQPGTGCYRASYPAVQWDAIKCVTAPKTPFIHAPRSRSALKAAPAEVGDGSGYSAQVSGLISQATGTFADVSPGISEQGGAPGSGSYTANDFTLQLNSQPFVGSPACDGSSNEFGCVAWQQFVYAYESPTSSVIAMQYTLINYDATCPADWTSTSSSTTSNSCYLISAAAPVPTLTAAQLASVSLTGSATSAGDSVSLDTGSGQVISVGGSDNFTYLSAFWDTTEWGVYGPAGGGEAYFGPGTTLQAQTALTSTSSAAPSCVQEGFTGETNNLTPTSTPVLGSQPSPTMATMQTNGTTGTANCAVATVAGEASPLQAGQVLPAGDALVSPGGQYVLDMQTDGNLVVYGNGCVIWASGTNGTGSGDYLAMQTDGNLIIYTSAGVPVWSSRTNGTGSGDYLAMQADGNLVVYNSSGSQVWAAGRANADELCTGGELHVGQYLYSPSGQYEVTMQPDGNLVVYTSAGVPLRATGTNGTGSANFLAMQADGNLVIYTSAGVPVWSSGTNGTGSGNYLVMQDDGNAVVYTSSGTAVWASQTLNP
jgi:hypothetical protein